MARIKYAPGETPIKGKRAGATFQTSDKGQVVLNKQKNDRTRNTRQMNRMQSLQRAIRYWREMDAATQTAWSDFATAYPQASRRNPATFLTGYQLFLKRNSYIFLNNGIDADFMEIPTLESLPDPDISFAITQDKNCLDITELFIANFGLLPEPGQYLLAKLYPMSTNSGQFFTPIEQIIQVDNVYIDGLFVSITYVTPPTGISFSLYLSKVKWESQSYAGSKVRYMGCFSAKTFLELTDTPDDYTDKAGNHIKVSDDETQLEFINLSDLASEVSEGKCGLVIFDENSEWNAVPSGPKIEVDNTDDPFNKTISIFCDEPPINSDVTFIAPTDINHNLYTSIICYIKLLDTLAASQDIKCVFTELGSHQTDLVDFPIDKNLTDEWQALLIPLANFVWDQDTFSEVMIFLHDISGSADYPKMYIDYVALLHGTTAPDCTCFCPPASGSDFDCSDVMLCPGIIEILSNQQSIINYLLYIEKLSFPVVRFGALYTFYTVVDSRKLFSSDDWDCPSTAYVDALLNQFGGASVAAEYLREDSLKFWLTGYLSSDNAAGFNARGSGYRTNAGVFVNLLSSVQFWTNESYNTILARQWSILYSSQAVTQNIQAKYYGKSVRGVKFPTTLTDGETGFYYGNDGKQYRTICIANREWLADSLCETLFRDGTPIPEITDTATWAANRASALCAYNNDWNNV